MARRLAGRLAPLLTLFLSALLAATAAAAEPAATVPYARQEGGFSGEFTNAAGTRLSLHPGSAPGRFAGLLEHGGQPRAVVGDRKGAAIEGMASGTAGFPDFRATFRQEALEVSLGGERLQLQRVAPVLPAIADLGPVQRDPQRRWTVAVYLGGDNDLEAAAMQDLREIAQALPAQGVEVVVLLDRARGHLEEEGGWTDADIFRYDPARRTLRPVKALGEVNTGDASTLASFLVGAFRTFPAQHHAAIVWNHGGGWGGIAVDEDTGRSGGQRDLLDLQEIRAALRTAVTEATGRPLDLLAFDACLMAQLEVALQVEDLADVMVASEDVVPGEGFPYPSVIPLFADPRLTPRQLAVRMVQAFGQSYQELQKPATTLSAFDLRRTAGVALALDRFVAAAEAGLSEHWPATARALFYAESYEPRAQRLNDGQTPSVDLLDLAQRITAGSPSPALRQAYAELAAAVGRLVITSGNGDLRRRSHGLSIYGLRTPAQWSDAYAGTALAPSRWPRFLRRVQELAARQAGEPVRIGELALATQGGRQAVRPFNGDRLQFSVDGRGIVQVLQQDALRDAQDKGWLVLRRTWVPDPAWMARAAQASGDLADLFMPVFQDGRNPLSVELTGLQFVISNGSEEAARATLDTTALAVDAPIVAQALWYPAGTPRAVPVEVHFDRIWWRVAAIYARSASAQVAPRQVQPAREDAFAFVLESVGDDGRPGQVLAPRLRWRDGLSLVLTADAADRYQTTLLALTMDGRRAAASLRYTVEDNPALADWARSWQVWNPARLQGTWSRELLTGPNQWRDLDSPSTIGAPLARQPDVFKVQSAFGPQEARQSVEQVWLVDTRGLPSLRIVQPLEPGKHLAWYGPAGIGSEQGRLFVAMKAVQVGGVIWRWRQSQYDALTLPASQAPGR